MPALSPARPAPEDWPKPKPRSASYSLVLPSCWATSTVPMLDDFASTPVKVRCSTPCSSASWKTRSYTCLLYTSDAADDLLCVDLGGRRIIKKKKKSEKRKQREHK